MYREALPASPVHTYILWNWSQNFTLRDRLGYRTSYYTGSRMHSGQGLADGRQNKVEVLSTHLWSQWHFFLWKKVKVKAAQSCPTLCDRMDCIVHGILQARTLEWVAFPFSRGSSQSRDQTQVSRIAGGFFTSWATREAQEYWSG